MRKSRAKARPILPDPKFKDQMVTKFVNNLMYDGKKNNAFVVFYDALGLVEKKMNQNGLEVFKIAIDKLTPQVEVRSRRVGGATFQIPQEIRASRKLALAMKWLIDYSRKRNGKSMSDKLAEEIMAAHKEEGAAYKKKEDVHKMAEANKAYSHFKF